MPKHLTAPRSPYLPTSARAGRTGRRPIIPASKPPSGTSTCGKRRARRRDVARLVGVAARPRPTGTPRREFLGLSQERLARDPA